ncbi:carnitine 3-dehydrogenase [Paracoccus sp. MBLB3053]|uniref:Carnitine 3-dehydrogenase n=1 Tax=Paracoccus aurantius TaxID=3073814 RepID=A0ABU2HXS9_9RHOB|nr:carnitine 3-dehydrogenase [Paracoccus sp. MBLB3053]MDS9469320.1 carnitine 3-dehydrogenase [Paracoccus sp. MBLB3053]
MSKAAIIGGGVIGGGWAARFLLNGWDVAVCDPDPEAGRKIGEVLANARRSLPALYDRALPPEGKLSFHTDLAEAVTGARWVQESVPERLEIKHQTYREIATIAPGGIIGSSTSGFKASELAIDEAEVVVVHPFNPVYLLPLVELSGPAEPCERAAAILRGIGMRPLTLRKEIDAFIVNRFQECVWREALWMIRDDVATTAEIDDAIRLSFGLRWGQMGLFETYRIAGGEAGFDSYLRQFGPSLSWPWSKLTDVPELDEKLVAAICAQSDEQSGSLSIRELERLRDDNLVGFIRALRHSRMAAGLTVLEHEAGLPEGGEHEGLPITSQRQVPVGWTDYNGHMNEAHYLEAGSWATDGLMRMIGVDAAYIEGGHSFFTVDTRLRYLAEVHAGDRLTITTQVLAAEGKKMLLFHRIWRGDGTLAATIETLQVHTDLSTRRSSLPDPAVAAELSKLVAAHRGFPVEGVAIGFSPAAVH